MALDNGGNDLNGEPIEPWTVLARNDASTSANKIHDDAVARQYGFAGGLVPGVTVYGYLLRPVVAALGRAWIGRGMAEVRLHAPVYDGEQIRVEGTRTEDTVQVTVRNPAGDACAVCTASLVPASARPDAPDTALHAPAPLPAHRPPASVDAFAAIQRLGSLSVVFDAEQGAAFADFLGDDLPWYRGPDALAHPGWLLRYANRILSSNVELGPWIHVSSVVRHLGTVTDGQTIEVLGRVNRTFERKGHEFVDLDVLLRTTAGEVATVLHRAIYKPRPLVG